MWRAGGTEAEAGGTETEETEEKRRTINLNSNDAHFNNAFLMFSKAFF